MSRARLSRPFIPLMLLAASLRCGGDVTIPSEGLPSHIVIMAGDQQSGMVGAQLPESLVVRITDAEDRPVVGERIRFTPLGAVGSLVPDTAVTGSDGRAWARWVLGSSAGPVQVQARVLGRSGSGDPVEITFSATALPGPPHTLYAVGGEGQTAAAGSPLDDPLEVQVDDQFGNPVKDQTIAWTADSGGAVSLASTQTDAQGRASISWTLGPRAGVQTSHAAVAGTPIAPVDFTATAVPGAAAQVQKIFGDGQTAPAGAALTDSVVIRIVDALGNGIPGRSVSWVVSGGGGSVAPGTSTTNALGETFTRWTLGPTAGAQTINAVVSGFAAVPFAATAVALQPATIQAASSTTLVGTAGVAVSPVPAVRVLDGNGNPVRGVTVSFIVVAGGGNVSDGTGQGSVATVATDASGIARLTSWTLGTLAGSGTVDARASGPGGSLTGSPVSFSAFGFAGAAAQLAFLQEPGTIVAGQAIVPAVTVAVEDANGNIVQGSTASIRLALGTNPAGGSLSGSTTVNALNGVATFGGLSVDKATTGYTLVASGPSGITPATSTAFGVVAGPPARLAMVSQPPAAAPSGIAFTQHPVVQLEDGFGNPVSQANVLVTVTIASGGGTLNGNLAVGTSAAGIATFLNLAVSGLAGTRTLLFSAPGVQAVTSTTINVVAGPPAVIAKNAGDAQSAPVGTAVAIAPSVKVSDASGNPVAGIVVGFAVGSGGGSVTGAGAITNASGIAAVGSWTLGSAKGSNTLTATSLGLTGSPVTFTATGRFAYLSIAAGAEFSCGISSAATPYCWGRSDRGQVGNGSLASQTSPVLVSGGRSFTAIGLGDSHACGITSLGVAYCWGRNANGQLGDGTNTDRITPTPVGGGVLFSSIDGGESHTCALTATGVARCWGRNDRGQVGDGSTTDRPTPVPVAGGHTFIMLALGRHHTCGLSTGHVVYCWGENGTGQLGDGTTTDRLSPVAVAGANWSALTVGEDFSCAIGPTGAASCWGRNDKGQLGDNTKTDRTQPTTVSGGVAFTRIDAGDKHVCGLTAGGTAYCWGLNSDGQLGDGTNVERHVPTPVQGNRTFSAVNAGGLHTLAVDQLGAAYGWGRDASGQLGTGTTGSKLTPVPVIEP